MQVGPALLPIFKYSLRTPAEGLEAGAAGATSNRAGGRAGQDPSEPSMALELQVSGLQSLQSLLDSVVPPGVRLHSLKLLASCLPVEAVLGCVALGQLAALHLEGCEASPVACAVLRSAMGSAPPTPAGTSLRLGWHEVWHQAGAPAPAAC